MAMQEMSYDGITNAALDAFDDAELSPFDLLERLMDVPGVPMHDPVHHYIMPAVLLVQAAKSAGADKDQLAAKLAIAEERARKLLPGFCGWWGACGAAVGCGVFASVWLEASPKQERNWAKINKFTSRCLAKVASVDGPRCCKRTSFLALGEAINAAPEVLDVDLGAGEAHICNWSAYNAECRRHGCPFYNEKAYEDGQSMHRHLHSRL